ncbi:MAG: gliding motility-associated protein GldE [Candidatus Delongbacteria bacterium]|jgi:putative hemolysin|nr:gliding motility-associated protein GldE [Candidatus Delongbacteria bacterium]
MGTGIGILLIVFLIMCSALVSGSEVAYFSLTPTDQQIISGKNNRVSRMVLKLLNKPEFLLATILVANNFINVGIVILSAYVTAPLLHTIESEALRFLIQVVVVSFLLLLFGELMPKVYANKFARKYAMSIAIPLNLISKLFYPVSALLTKSTNVINKRLRKRHKNISMDELSQAIELASENLVDEREMLEGIVNFSNIQVKEIMKPRLSIVGLDISSDINKLLSVIVDSGYSRLPVYKDNLDNIQGILYAKDLLSYLNQKEKKDFTWQNLIRNFYFVPESKKISTLLEKFQQKKIHLAIVVDEYGGTSGLVTLEDILEEIVGEIIDESDMEENLSVKTGKHTWEFDARISLNDFCKIVEYDSKTFDDIRGDADSLAGLILEIKGEMPDKNENVPYKNFVFTIKSVDNRRIKSIKVYVNDDEA